MLQIVLLHQMSLSVATAQADVFQKNWISMPKEIAKIVGIFYNI